jgi:1,4-alpha-glucan branching enzyme
MIKRQPGGEYEFRLEHPAAHEVFLVGNFDRRPGEACVPMARTASGEWTCRLPLKEGVYEFKYWSMVNGAWTRIRAPRRLPPS